MKEIHAYELAKAVNGTILSGSEDTLITSVSTNSKEIEAGALFVPIVGERVDAHDFIDMALEAGAVATFTARKCSEFLPGKVYIQVEDTTKALQQAAAWYRSLFDVKIVGITGSVGKTTTKEMIAAALSTKYNVLKTKGNMNSQIGLPLMMFYGEEPTAVFPSEFTIVKEPLSSLTGEAKIEKAVLRDGTEVKIDGLFVAYGVASSAALAQKAGAVTIGGKIRVNDSMMTNVNGLFAAGDCTGGLLQVSKAVGDGAAAGMAIIKYIKRDK